MSLRLSEGPALPLRHLIVVAGARGAGKTTFLWDLVKRRLPPEVRRLVPLKAPQWPQAEASDFDVWLPMIGVGSGEGGRIENLVLHYDLVNYFAGLHPEALLALEAADNLIAITIAPPLDRLTFQYASRTADFRSSVLEEGEMPGRARNHVARSLLTYPEQPANMWRVLKHIDDSRKRVLAHYSETGWLDELYRRWDEEIRRRFCGSVFRAATIEPGAPGVGDADRWRLRPAR